MTVETAKPAAEAQAPAAASQQKTAPVVETKVETGTPEAKGVSGETKSPPATPEAKKSPDPAAPTTLLGKKLPPAEPAKATAEGSKEGEKKAEEYEVALPEGAILGPDQAKSMTEQYRKLGLSKDQAQALATHADGMVRSYVDAQVAKLNETEAGWWKELEANPKLGGANLTQSDKLASAALDRFFPGLKEDLMNSPYAAHPKLFPGLVELGKLISDAKFRTDVLPPTPKPVNPAHALYGEDGQGKNVVKKSDVAP